MKKHPHLLDKAVVAALLLAYVPGLADCLDPTPALHDFHPPIALIAPAPESAEDTPADGL